MKFKGFDDWVQIFEGGQQTDSEGVTHNGNELIDKAVAQFSSNHEPPVCIGHPKDNAPAWGWVEGLKKEGQSLWAKFKQVQPEFEDMVKRGMFKKRSAAFYPDGSLRHVAFLGASPPAVKGMPDMAFSDKAITFEYSDSLTNYTLAGILGRLRDYLIEKDGIDKANQIIGEYDVDALKTAATAEEDVADDVQPVTYKEKSMKELLTKLKELVTFAEAVPGEVIKNPDEEIAKAVAAEKVKLESEYSEKYKSLKRDAKKAEIKDWCDAMVAKGKITPAMLKCGIPEFMEVFAESDSVIEFGETKEKDTLYNRFKMLIETDFPKVEYKEVATRDKVVNSKDKREEIIAAFVEANKVGYKEAVLAIAKEQPELFNREEN